MRIDIRHVAAALRRHRTATMLIGLQIALACAVLCNALFLLSNRLHLMSMVSGVDEQRLVVVSLQGTGNDLGRDALLRVKQALHGRIRHRSNDFQERFAKFADGFESSIRTFGRAGIAPYDATQILVVQVSREWIGGQGLQEREETIKILGSSRHEFCVPFENLPGIA